MKRLTLVEWLFIVAVISLIAAFLVPRKKYWERKEYDIRRIYTDIYYDLLRGDSKTPEKDLITALERRTELAKLSLANGRFFVNNDPAAWTNDKASADKDPALFAFIANNPEDQSIIHWHWVSLHCNAPKEQIFIAALWDKNPPVEITPEKLKLK